jgi:riboflavin synthase
MKSPTIKILILSLCLLLTYTAKAQIVTTNPLEYAALAEGNELILGKVKDQIDGQRKTALLQNTIAAEFEQMRQWEKKYNSYLKTASGFASSIKACTHLYNDGVRIFITLGKLKNAVSDNPQGIVASMNMNNLYIETATELVTVFSLLRDAVAKGGKDNMLTGAERSQILWALNDQFSAFQKKLNLLYLSIRTYTMTDVWNNATAGMLDRNNGEIAQIAMQRWRRAATIR